MTYPIKDEVVSFVPKTGGEKIRFAQIGAIQPRKGQDVAVQAIKLLDEHIRSKAVFTFVGEDMYPEYAKTLHKDAEGVPEIEFLGVVKDRKAYHELYENFDILLCPSREDPYPLVVIDALMHGVPVIISDRVGQKDLIQNHKNGFVFESENSKELADIIRKVIKERDSISELSFHARQTYINHFDFETCAKTISVIMENLCKKSL